VAGAPGNTVRPDSGGGSPRDAGATSDGGGAPGIPAVSLPSRQIGPLTGATDTIAADANGVYWLNHDNQLWMVGAAAGDVPRQLAAETGPSIICSGYGRLAAADDQLFWIAEWSGPGNTLNGALHRTSTTGDDVALVNDIAYGDPIDVVVDATDVYWNEGMGDGAPPPATFVRALPRDAAPGTSPQALVTVPGFEQVASVALVGSDLYWTTVFLGTTVFMPQLQRADLGQLRLGTVSAPTLVASNAWMVRGHEGDLFLDQAIDLWHTALARVPESLGPATDLASFGDSALGEIVFLDRWALTSVESGGCGSLRYTLLAIPTDAVGPTVQLAADLVTPAVLGEDLAFIDAAAMLHLVSVDDVRAALAGVTAPAAM
jgi:hypothetical protein